MDRIPSWTELMLEATKLIQTQRRCYQSVHHMLDHSIPHLDSKLTALNNEYAYPTARAYEPVLQESPRYEVIREHPTIPRTTSNLEHVQRVPLPNYNNQQRNKFYKHENEYENDNFIPNLPPARKITIPRSQTHSALMTFSPPRSPATTTQNKPRPRKHEPSKKQPMEPKIDEMPEVTQPKTIERQPMILKKIKKRSTRVEPIKNNEPYRIDFGEYEHLKAPPMPLSQYLSINRPNTMSNIHQRAMNMHDKVLRRKLLATRVIDSFERLRISSRNSSNNGYPAKQSQQQHRPSSRGTYVTCNAPNFQVKCNISEEEMRRRTAKTYRKLPEVKEKQKKEMTKIMRIENYKKQKEYARKLLENRRHGRINYPLRTSCEDNSVISSQNDDSINSTNGPGSADAFCSDPFY